MQSANVVLLTTGRSDVLEWWLSGFSSSLKKSLEIFGVFRKHCRKCRWGVFSPYSRPRNTRSFGGIKGEPVRAELAKPKRLYFFSKIFFKNPPL